MSRPPVAWMVTLTVCLLALAETAVLAVLVLR